MLGYSESLIGSLPKEVGSGSSGGGSVTLDSDGAHLTCGATAGDNATLDTVFPGAAGTPQLEVWYFAATVAISSNTFPTEADMWLGIGRSDKPVGDSRNGAFFTPHTGEFSCQSNTQAIDDTILAVNTPGSAPQYFTIEILQDNDKGEANFRIATNQGVDTATLAGTITDSRQTRARITSNGTDNGMHIMAMQESWGMK